MVAGLRDAGDRGSAGLATAGAYLVAASRACRLVCCSVAGRCAAEEVAAQAMVQLGMEPAVLHSTSWRHAGKEVVLTYIAVVPPGSAPPPSWQIVEVARSELARGDATAPPSSIGIMHVQEHALRHLAWLRQDDPTIAGLLGDWSHALSDYIPEPFRAFGGLAP